MRKCKPEEWKTQNTKSFKIQVKQCLEGNLKPVKSI